MKIASHAAGVLGALLALYGATHLFLAFFLAQRTATTPNFDAVTVGAIALAIGAFLILIALRVLRRP